MTKKQHYVDATLAKNQFGAVMNQALLEPIIITSRRRPKVVLMSYAAYTKSQIGHTDQPKLTFGQLMKDLPAATTNDPNLSERYKDVLYGNERP